MRQYIVIALLGLLMVSGQALAKEHKAPVQEKAPMAVEQAEQAKAPEQTAAQTKDAAAASAPVDGADDDAQETSTQK